MRLFSFGKFFVTFCLQACVKPRGDLGRVQVALQRGELDVLAENVRLPV